MRLGTRSGLSGFNTGLRLPSCAAAIISLKLLGNLQFTKENYPMKKLMTLTLALSFLTGVVAYAQDKPADTKTEKTKKKKGGKKKTDKMESEKKS